VAQARYQMHVAEMESLRAGTPPDFVNHSSGGGAAIRDIHMENFNVTVGGRDLIQQVTITLAFGRHYGNF
jgi:ATP-binding cassette, subfamily F, member 3